MSVVPVGSVVHRILSRKVFREGLSLALDVLRNVFKDWRAGDGRL